MIEKEITEHKQAEEALRLANAYNRSLIEASLDPLVTIGPDGKITDVNAATEKITGHSSKELIGTDFMDYFSDPEKAKAGYQQVFQDGFVHDYALEIRHKDGHLTPVLYTASVYRDEAGQVIGVFAAARDITERKRAEEELRKASLYARSLIEASLDPLVTISSDGKIMDVNQATEQVTGITRNRLIGSDFSDYFTEFVRAREGYQRVLTEGLVRDYALSIRHISGRTTDVLYNAAIYRSEAGEVQGVFAAARDITERKKAEEALRLANAYNRSLIEASLDPLVTIGSDGRITDVNAATEKVTGLSREELIGTDFMDYFSEPEKAKAGYQKVFQDGFVQDYALEIRHKAGNLTPVLYNASVYRDEAGQVMGVFAAARDITERKRAEEEVRTLNAELEQRVVQRTTQLEAANKELEAFSYSVSHDLRAPLRAIDGFSRVILEDYMDELDDEGKRVLNIIRSNTQKMGQLIDDLLVFSRLGRQEIRVSEINMERLAKTVFEEGKPTQPERKMRLTIRQVPPSQGDPAMIKQVFSNLLSNAIKFTQPKEAATIELGGFNQEKENVYYVKDNGVGFDMQYVHKLFGVFQRLHSSEEFEGTGVGLAIVQRIVHRHGGRVWAEGKVNEGATFYFTLPRERRE